MNAGSLPAALETPPLDRMRGICPWCRRLAPAGVACLVDGALIEAPALPRGRARLREAMWGPGATRRSRGPGAPRASGAAVGAVSLLAGTALVLGGKAGLVVLAGAAVARTAGALAGQGAAARPAVVPAAPLPAWPRVGVGRVVDAAGTISPGSLARCAAWAVELRVGGRGGTATLRAGATAGFDVVLDGGDRVRVAAGECWIDGFLPQIDEDDGAVSDLVAVLDPAADPSALPLLPYDVVAEDTVAEGETIEVLGEVTRRPVADEGGLLYRDAPASVLVHAGLPVLRRVPRGGGRRGGGAGDARRAG